MDILEQAIADAKSIREAAVANAKATLEETFRPTLHRMISSRLEEEGDEDEIEMGDDVAAPAPEAPAEEAPVEDVPEAPAEEAPSQDDLDLEELLAELDALDGAQGSEEEMPEGYSDEDEDMMEGDGYDSKVTTKHKNLKETEDADADDVGGDSDPEEVDLDELLDRTQAQSAIAENKKLKAKLAEALKAVSILKKAINETTLLNAKLMYATKLSKQFQLSEAQKTKMLESFDRASNPRECTLLYTALAQSLAADKSAKKPVQRMVTESATRSLGKKTPDQFSQKTRFMQLSGIIPLND